MKSLVLMRHGKSSWEFDVSDKERPLKTLGITDAKAVANEFSKISSVPDKVFSSPANRALTTCKIFAKNTGISYNNIEIIDELYDFGGQSVIDFVKNLDDNYQNIIIFGHNFAFTSIVNSFGSIYIDNLPTAGLAKINFEIESWRDLTKGETELLLIPKDLR